MTLDQWLDRNKDGLVSVFTEDPYARRVCRLDPNDAAGTPSVHGEGPTADAAQADALAKWSAQHPEEA